jgi:hypothetical protein
MLWPRIAEVLCSIHGRDTGYADVVCRDIRQPLQTNPGLSFRLGYNRFLPDPFQFISNPTVRHYTV